jgi:manganese-dependent inorganic pyrophosphatase
MPLSTDRHEFWDASLTYVIGHQRPDTDSIASALGYAWLLQQTGHPEAQATRCGQPGEQTRYALDRFQQAPPRLLTDVAPTFHHVLEKRAPVAPDAPLSAALDRLAGGEHAIPVANGDGQPRGVVTPLGVARAYARSLAGGANCQTPVCGEVAENIPTFQSRAKVSDHRHAVLRADHSEFLIVDDRGLYEGIATQRRLLQPPRARLILVDHNELSQAVAGAEEAEIIGVLDHHRLGNPPTAAPIPFTVDPVGSTSTLVAEHCRARRMTPPRPIAGVLLSGILSDTLVFRSPTTHERDFDAADWLGGVCRIDVLLYGEELLRASPGLSTRTVDDIIDGDRKEYEMGGLRVSIGQVEVTGMQEVPQQREGLLQVMEERRNRENLALIALMITDVVTGKSHLLARGERNIVDALPFHRVNEDEFDLNDIVSRKKQLAPAVQDAIESIL